MINATIDVPIKVADQYSHKLTNTPESKVGANERAGFIDAPGINPKKKISKPSIPPIAIPPEDYSINGGHIGGWRIETEMDGCTIVVLWEWWHSTFPIIPIFGISIRYVTIPHKIIIPIRHAFLPLSTRSGLDNSDPSESQVHCVP